MVVDDQQFGELVGTVKSMDGRLCRVESKIGDLHDAYQQAKGAGTLLSPFKGPLINLICALIGGGIVYYLAK